ncbi:methionine biosynthesis protein MetW [Actinokineospora sp.]|uniref:methionine biosynthesis protein MetW n=1 Tax=Actinokineospora sp. TaxID=1872133 RepID=UPI003D6C41A2
METINTGQAEAWNGYEGRHWADHHDRYNAINREFNPAVLDLIGPGDRVLDIGCGAGQLTRLAAVRGDGAMGLDRCSTGHGRSRPRRESTTSRSSGATRRCSRSPGSSRRGHRRGQAAAVDQRRARRRRPAVDERS